VAGVTVFMKNDEQSAVPCLVGKLVAVNVSEGISTPAVRIERLTSDLPQTVIGIAGRDRSCNELGASEECDNITTHYVVKIGDHSNKTGVINKVLLGNYDGEPCQLIR
jgi:hypothetical protein